MTDPDSGSEPISKAQSAEIFLNEYYFASGWYYSLLRILAGPLAIVWGTVLYTDGAEGGLLAYSGFMIGFGVYYLLKPCLVLLLSKTWRNNLNATYRIEDETLSVELDGIRSEVGIPEIRTVREETYYFAVRLSGKQHFYISKHIAPAGLIDGLRKLREEINEAT